MALVSIGLETLVFEPDTQTTRPIHRFSNAVIDMAIPKLEVLA